MTHSGVDTAIVPGAAAPHATAQAVPTTGEITGSDTVAVIADDLMRTEAPGLQLSPQPSSDKSSQIAVAAQGGDATHMCNGETLVPSTAVDDPTTIFGDGARTESVAGGAALRSFMTSALVQEAMNAEDNTVPAVHVSVTNRLHHDDGIPSDGLESTRDADVQQTLHEVDAENSGASQSSDSTEHDAQSDQDETDGKGRECAPKPFARRLRLHIDACAGTNKSQYCFGGLALLVSLGILDVVWISFMVPGHTKFAPDLVARAIAGVYNKVDVFNMGMLLECAQRCSSAQSYDADTMYHWKECTKQLFGAVDNIMSYRQFFILPEHDAVDLGESVPLPSDMEPFPGNRAPLRRHDVLQAAAKAVYESSIRRIARECIENKYAAGVGAGARANGPSRLHPSSVNSFMRVRLFMRRNESEPVWREQKDWMHRSVSLEMFNESLQKLRPYSETPDAGREHYGKKLSGIREQYNKYVPPMYVPDDVELSPGGMTMGMGISGGNTSTVVTTAPGSSRQTVVGEHFPRAAADISTQTEPVAERTRDVRWSSSTHTPILRSVLMREFSGSVPKSSADVKKLVLFMQQECPAPPGFVWDGGKLRKRAKDILKQPIS